MRLTNTTRFGFFLCVFFLAFLLFGNVMVAKATTATVEVSSLNIRSGPGLTFEVVTKVKKGQLFPVLETDGEWVKLQLTNEKTGWAAKWLLHEMQGENQQQIEATVNFLRVRSSTSTDSKILGYLHKGTTYPILEESGEWIGIPFGNGKGWIHSSFTTKVVENKPLGKVSVLASSLRIREEPSLQSTIIGLAKEGEAFSYYKIENGWYRIAFEEKIGWLSGEYVVANVVEKDKIKEKNNITPTKKQQIVNASILNVRMEPSLFSSVVAKVQKGSVLSSLEKSGEWTQIEDSNVTGWVMTKYLTEHVNKENIKILTNGTNIRKEPSLQSDILRKSNQGDSFPVISKQGEWFEIAIEPGMIGYVADWVVQLTEKESKGTIKDKTIVIDPGHGGRDFGAISKNGINEKSLTLQTALLLEKSLKATGANVHVTRREDSYVTLTNRVSLSHYYQADAFISLHYDSTSDRSVNGISTFYYNKNKDLSLASAIHSQLIETSGLKDRQVKNENFYVIRNNYQPSVLLELGFLSNEKEERVITTEDYQEKIVQAIQNGLVSYFSKK